MERRDSAPGLFVSDLGVPTCFTDAADIADEPLLGGTGGFEEECRRRWALEVNDAATEGVVGRLETAEALEQLRATRRSEVLNMCSQEDVKEVEEGRDVLCTKRASSKLECRS